MPNTNRTTDATNWWVSSPARVRSAQWTSARSTTASRALPVCVWTGKVGGTPVGPGGPSGRVSTTCPAGKTSPGIAATIAPPTAVKQGPLRGVPDAVNQQDGPLLRRGFGGGSSSSGGLMIFSDRQNGRTNGTRRPDRTQIPGKRSGPICLAPAALDGLRRRHQDHGVEGGRTYDYVALLRRAKTAF